MHSQVHPFVSHGPQDELLPLERLLSTELAPLESSTATHVHWPAHRHRAGRRRGLGGGLLDGGVLDSLDGGMLDGSDEMLDGCELDPDGSELDGELDDGELDDG